MIDIFNKAKKEALFSGMMKSLPDIINDNLKIIFNQYSLIKDNEKKIIDEIITGIKNYKSNFVNVQKIRNDDTLKLIDNLTKFFNDSFGQVKDIANYNEKITKFKEIFTKKIKEFIETNKEIIKSLLKKYEAEDDIDYYSKYMKYKHKYLELKALKEKQLK